MNSKKRCKHCKEYFPAEGMKKTPVGWFCCIEHAVEHAFEARKNTKHKAHTEKKKAFRLSDRAHQFKLTKAVIQKWVTHTRDAGLPCISCGTTKDVIYSGGHYRTAGGHPEIALNSMNIHRQCLNYCNKNKSGNIGGDKHSIGFRVGLIERYGLEYVEWLEGHHESKKLASDELVEIRKLYNKLIRDDSKDDSEIRQKFL